MNSNFKNPDEYIMMQIEERREYLSKIRSVINDNLPNGYEEGIQYGMISYFVPHSIYPSGYHVNHKEPLPFISLGNQKGHIALYHSGIYMDSELLNWFKMEYEKLDIGKLDMGKSCIRFKKMDKIPYELIGVLCTKISVDDFIKMYEKTRNN